MGVVPGLKVTGSGLTASLHELNGRTGMRLGALWTTLVVAQIAVAVAVLPAAVYLSWQVARMELVGPGFPAEKFVVASVALGEERSAIDSTRFSARQLDLGSRLQAEAGVSAVTFSSSIPGFAAGRRIQFEDGTATREPGLQEVSSLDVALEMFDVYGAEILAGRDFSSADLGSANAVIVNRTFVRQLLADESRSALGLRFRYPSTGSGQGTQSKWYQIIGVVRDFPAFSPSPVSDGEPTDKQPAAPGTVEPCVISVRFKGPIPAGMTDRIRQIGAEVDPALQLRRVVPLSDFYGGLRAVWRYLAWGVGLLTASVMLLSAAGIYALMSFTVAQRTREIGIRAALGAAPNRLLLGIFGRVIRQLAVGVVTGSLLSAAALSSAGVGAGKVGPLLFAVASLMLVVGLLAASGPARRSLRIQAIDALRAEG
jgi:hypothetical protein